MAGPAQHPPTLGNASMAVSAGSRSSAPLQDPRGLPLDAIRRPREYADL